LDADGEIPGNYVFDKTKANLEKPIEGHQDYQVGNGEDVLFPNNKSP